MQENLARAYVISKIKQIAADEKFKLDAFFFCGFPGGTPNEKLMQACEAYLEMVQRGQMKKEVRERLLCKLEAAAASEKKEQVGILLDNQSDIQEVLSYKRYL